MLAPIDIARHLPAAHAMLNAVRPRPVDYVELPGARVGVLPGDDSPFASATKNRATIYDPLAGDLIPTLHTIHEIYAAAGIRHWFTEIGPGLQHDVVATAASSIGARPVPYVRYPVLARIPSLLPHPPTTLDIHRVSPDQIHPHAEEIDAIWERPGASAAGLRAAELPGYAVVLAFDAGRAVGMGMVIAPNASPIAYFSSGGTHKSFRNRGGQSALIVARLRIAHEWGRTVCVSETVSAVMTSENNLRRAGFETAFEWTMFEYGQYAGA